MTGIKGTQPEDAGFGGQPIGVQQEFRVGERVMYPGVGLAEVIGLEEAGMGRSYALRILKNSSLVRIAVNRASDVGLRQLASSEEIRNVFQILRERPQISEKRHENNRYRLFVSKLGTGSIYEVAEVVCYLGFLESNRALSWRERVLLDRGMNMIASEIALTGGRNRDEVRKEIEAIYK